MKKYELNNALKTVLFDDFHPKPYKQASIIIGLCGFYGKAPIPEAIQTELTKLNSQLPILFALGTLLEALEVGRRNDFRWEPHFHPNHMPANLTMNPTFNIQRGDDSSIVAEIEKLRNELQQQSVNIVLLISHIGVMAREAGDLNLEEND